jgi:hypothetical protein
MTGQFQCRRPGGLSGQLGDRRPRGGRCLAAEAVHRRAVLRHGPTVLGHERRRAFRATGRIAAFRESVLGRNRAALVPCWNWTSPRSSGES